MSRRLPFTPRAQPGESPLSLLRRGALGNGHHSTLRFAFAVNPALHHAPTALGTLARNPEVFRATGRGMGLTDDEIAAISYQRSGQGEKDDVFWHGLPVETGDLQFRRTKLCMACYLEQGFALAEWDHVCAVACAKHHALLTDACPCCEKPWSYIRDPLACGCDPAEIIRRQPPCDPLAASLLRRLIEARDGAGLRLLGKLGGVIRFWRHMGLAMSAAWTAVALQRLHTGTWPQQDRGRCRGEASLHPRVALAPLLAAGGEYHEHARRLLSQAAPTLMLETPTDVRWPTSLAEAVLDTGRMSLRRLVECGNLAKNAGGTVSALQINAVLLTAPLVQRRSAQSPPRKLVDPRIERSRITIADAAAHLGTNTESVRSVMRSGLLLATQGDENSGVRWNIDARALDTFHERYVFASAIATQLGASRTTLSSRLRSAGFAPISGPGIDGGATFLFRRGDLDGVDLGAIVSTPYRSPAGRKAGETKRKFEREMNMRDTAAVLGISARQLGPVVSEGWIKPREFHARPWRFDRSAVRRLARNVRDRYCSIDLAAEKTGQSVRAFRRTWIETGFAQGSSFAGRVLIRVEDQQRIEAAWRDLATSSAIGNNLGRTRSLCPNLQKIGRMPSPVVLGTGTRKVRLFRRDAESLARYAIPIST